MKINNLCFVVLVFLLSCATEDEGQVSLRDVIAMNLGVVQDEVIACAASSKADANTSFVFYYPIPTATNIQYFETESIQDDKNDFSLYKEILLPKEKVFNGYLERFVRESNKEVWCIVTYNSEGKFHKSNPIRIKNQSKPTEWIDEVAIDFPEATTPKFSWNDGTVKENAIYFQVVTDANETLLSGTYTFEKMFQYYNLSNVVLNVTRETPPALILGSNYGFTMMGVSEDNWVNLVIQKSFEVK
ncbi:conserved protein of unknown function [Tenacibaculum sp. 190130A14a]|uniref:Lipoprotein n=1 Tax=Tenacibaculum polynesiense TaxID=3137857 RepID=A0ABM9PEV3_9FLAO